MDMYPRLESRVSALEHRQTVLDACVIELSGDMKASFKQVDTRFNQVDARVGELSRDMTGSFKQLVEYQIHTEGQIDMRFNQVDTRLDKMEMDVADIKGDIVDIKASMATKEDLVGMATKEDLAGMATKEDLKTEIAAVRSDLRNDMTAMEKRILDGFKQLFVAGNPQRPASA